MRLRRFTFALPLSALAALVIAGCPDDKSLLHPNDVPDSTVPEEDAQADTGTDSGDSGPGPALVRFARLAPTDTAKIDVCLRAVPNGDAGTDAGGDSGTSDAGTEFVGPILQTLGLAEGLGYKEVTRYFDVTSLAGVIPNGNVEIIIVDGSLSNCDAAIGAPIFSVLPAIEPGSVRTLAAVAKLGSTGAVPSVQVLTDHTKVATAGKAEVRFVNANFSKSSLDFGFVSGTTFEVQASGVANGGGTLATANGYVSLDAFTDRNIAARVNTSAANTFVVNGVSAAAGSLTTVFAVGDIPSAPPVPAEGLVCKDSAPALGNLTDCTLVAPSDGGTDAGDAGGDAGDAGDGG